MSFVSQNIPTFNSYGVRLTRGPAQLREPQTRHKLVKHHQDFLRELPWIWERKTSWAPFNVKCVHAGMLSEDCSAQLEGLRSRDLSSAALLNTVKGNYHCLSGREDVEAMPPELDGQCALVSGHHNKTLVQGDRYIIDFGGGRPQQSMEALILPSRVIVNSDDGPQQLGSRSRV